MAYIRIDNIIFESAPATDLVAMVQYKLASDPDSSYVVWTTSANVLQDGTVSPPVLIDGLTTGLEYSIKITMTCGGISFVAIALATAEPTTTTTTTTSVPVYAWIVDDFTCEQDAIFTLEDTITGFSSPWVLYYDDVSGLYYGGDFDDTSGNVYKFDSDTISTYGDRIVIPGMTDTAYNIVVDKDYKRFYFVGTDTDGMRVFDIDTETFSNVAFGTDTTPFSRTVIEIVGDKIYLLDVVTSSITIVDRASLTVDSTTPVSSIPSGTTYFSNAFYMFSVGSEVWVGANNRANGNIGVYSPDLSTLITTITLPGIATELGGLHRQQQTYDVINDKLYVADAGSSKLLVIDGVTRAVVHSKTITNRLGKLFGFGGIIIDPISNDYFYSFQAYDSPGDSTKKYRTYKINPLTFEFEHMFKDVSFGQLVRKGTSDIVWGTFQGNRVWEGGSWSTDGTLLKYSR